MKKVHKRLFELPNDTVLYQEQEIIGGCIGGLHITQTTNVFTVAVKDCKDRNIIPMNVTEQTAKNMLAELYNI